MIYEVSFDEYKRKSIIMLWVFLCLGFGGMKWDEVENRG